jgi:hypothetical protein
MRRESLDPIVARPKSLCGHYIKSLRLGTRFSVFAPVQVPEPLFVSRDETHSHCHRLIEHIGALTIASASNQPETSYAHEV